MLARSPPSPQPAPHGCCRHRDCISDEHYLPSLLAMHGLDNEASCAPPTSQPASRAQLALRAGPRRASRVLVHTPHSASQLWPCPALTLACACPAWLGCLFCLQTTCDFTGGTYASWEAAVDTPEGGHPKLYQPGHIGAGGWLQAPCRLPMPGAEASACRQPAACLPSSWCVSGSLVRAPSPSLPSRAVCRDSAVAGAFPERGSQRGGPAELRGVESGDAGGTLRVCGCQLCDGRQLPRHTGQRRLPAGGSICRQEPGGQPGRRSRLIVTKACLWLGLLPALPCCFW